MKDIKPKLKKTTDKNGADVWVAYYDAMNGETYSGHGRNPDLATKDWYRRFRHKLGVKGGG